MASASNEIALGRKTAAIVLATVSIVSNTIALISLYKRGFDIPFHAWLDAVVTAYRDLTAPVFNMVFLPVLSYLFGVFSFELNLQPYASDIFVFLFSYFAILASVTFRLNKLWRLSIYYLIFGAISALTVLIVFGSIVVDSSLKSVVIPVACTFGIFIFTILTSLRASIYFPRINKNESRAQSFRYYSRHAWRYLVVGLLVSSLGFSLYNVFGFGIYESSPLSFGIICTSFLFLLLGIYRFYLGPYSGNMHPTDGPWLRKRLNSGEGLTGFYLILVVCSVLSTLLLNAVWLLAQDSS